ncbi:cytochrome P450-DIT2 [Rhypophila decipiens]|uniref:Cytochrome P450-DIT2 n=1 Tax=Rhypophila decipiens TaxID=261697 RepID=A0AAN6YHN4_9PEZI|nr:cytochrome P450-DIT2 [Rhypophila decipiens]
MLLTLTALGGLGLIAAGVAAIVFFVFLLPPKHPKNIPAIPFWVALLPFFKDVDQSDIFHKYMDKPLRTHGAVKLFFGAQWNLVVHRPSFLAEMFRDEDMYQKSGNQKKIPHSVLAMFLGDNIISSHGTTWKTYQAVVKPCLQQKFDSSLIAKNTAKLCVLIRQATQKAGDGGGIAVQELLQRYSVANCSEILLDMETQALERADAPLNVLQTAVKREIFQPVFMNFPVLDRLPFPSRKRARALVAAFKNELKSALVQGGGGGGGRKVSESKPKPGLGRGMLDAAETGRWSEKQLLDNLTVLFVAGQENPQLLMISTLYLLAKHPVVQDAILDEMSEQGTVNNKSADNQQLQELPYLTSVIYECLRLLPPIGQLINRQVDSDVVLGGGIFIPRGTYVGYNCYSTNRSPEAWGPDANEFRPERWGSTHEQIQRQYRQRRARAEFISFHGGRRACLGERFAMLQMRVLLTVLVRQFRWWLDPTWVDRKTPVSGASSCFSAGPLYPRALRLVFANRQEESSAGSDLGGGGPKL